MKIQIVIKHLATGTTSKSEIQEFTKQEIDSFKDMVKDNIDKMSYFEVGTDIWPGDVLRSSCVISFNIVE